MRKFVTAFAAACLIVLVTAASATAMSIAKAGDYTLAWASNNCTQHYRCLGESYWGCEWLYSGHARCRAEWDFINSNGQQLHSETDKYVYWKDDPNYGAVRYNLPTAVVTGPVH